jgi:hypothetical protein
MATDATGTQARRIPPAPSARTSSSRLTSVRPARRVSNHPAPLAGLAGAPGTGVRQTANPSSAVTSVTSYSTPIEQNSSVSASAVRDELARAVMPELRLLLQHMVETAVERSMAQLLDKQRELEAALNDVRDAQRRAEQSARTCAGHTPQPAAAPRAVHAEARPLANRASPAPATVIERPAVAARTEVLAARCDANALADLPPELNGSRRKKVLLAAFSVAAVALVLSSVAASVLSNMGTYF